MVSAPCCGGGQGGGSPGEKGVGDVWEPKKKGGNWDYRVREVGSLNSPDLLHLVVCTKHNEFKLTKGPLA